MAEIQKLANVDLKIEVLIEEDKIALSGLNVDVLKAENQIMDVILGVEKVRKQFFQFQWGFLSGSEVELYPENINFKLEEAYQRKETILKFEVNGRSMVVDLNSLTEYFEDDPGDTVRVVRKDKYSAAGKLLC